MQEKPNPNNPALVDIYDDEGNFVTTLPADTSNIEQVADPMTGQIIPQAPAVDVAGATGLDDIAHAVGTALEVPPLQKEPPAPPPAPVPGRQGVTDVIAKDGKPVVDFESTGFADPPPAEPEPEPMYPGTPGGVFEAQRQTSGLPEGSLAELRARTSAVADQERDALVSELLARDQANEDKKRRLAELQTEVDEARAKQALERERIVQVRRSAEAKIEQVSAQEPDPVRAFPSGFAAVATFIGAIAGGMLQGLNGGSNPVLDALLNRLNEDVRQQRLTQSAQLEDLTRKLGSADAAEDILRAQQLRLVEKETEARLLGSDIAVAPAQLEAFRKRMNAEISRNEINALAKLERDETIQLVAQPGTGPTPINAETYRARELRDYAQKNGLRPVDAQKQWVDFNVGFNERAELRKGLATATRLVEQFESTNDVAGLGPLARFIPTSINADDAVAVRQVMGNILAQYLRSISGAQVNEGEFKRLNEVLHGAQDFDSVRRGLGLMQQAVFARDEEAEVENPAFVRIRDQIRFMNERENQSTGRDEQLGMAQGGRRAQVQHAVGGRVLIPRKARIARVHNNPGNLVFAGQQGATRGEPKKGGGYWAKFETPEEGLLGVYRQMEKDKERDLTVRGLVEKYAPQNDGNDVDRYVDFLSRQLGVDEATPIREISTVALGNAIIQKESGTQVFD